MADKKNIHTVPVPVPVPTEDGWANRREGGQRASSTHDTKAEAQAARRATATARSESATPRPPEG